MRECRSCEISRRRLLSRNYTLRKKKGAELACCLTMVEGGGGGRAHIVTGSELKRAWWGEQGIQQFNN